MMPNERDRSEGSEGIEQDMHACRILITCAHPSGDGKMNVEMSYEGDPVLASYILERAQGFIDTDGELSLE